MLGEGGGKFPSWPRGKTGKVCATEGVSTGAAGGIAGAVLVAGALGRVRLPPGVQGGSGLEAQAVINVMAAASPKNLDR